MAQPLPLWALPATATVEESTATTSVVPPVVAVQVALGWPEATCDDLAMSDMRFIHVYEN